MLVRGFGVTREFENAAEAWTRAQVHKSFGRWDLYYRLLALGVPTGETGLWVAHTLIQKWRKCGLIQKAHGKRWLTVAKKSQSGYFKRGQENR
jgi:hypothetical protein